MSDDPNNPNLEGEYLTESDIRRWIGEELGTKLEGVATKNDISSAIADFFKANPSISESGSFDKQGLLTEIQGMIDGAISKNSGRRNPGFLTKILTAK